VNEKTTTASYKKNTLTHKYIMWVKMRSF